MVLIDITNKELKEETSDMLDDEDWEVEGYESIKERYDKDFNEYYPKIVPVDLISIGTKSGPIPLKNVSDDFLRDYEGSYLGQTDLIKALKEDRCKFKARGK